MASGTAIDREDPLKKALTHALALWALIGPLWVLVGAALRGKFALDFRHAFLPAAHAVLHGHSPYSAIGSRALSEGTAFLYPPLGAYLLAPFTVLPALPAEIVAVVLVAAALPATLWVLGVRDWRCYAIALLWWPTLIAIQTGNLTLPMLLALALAWRYRDRPVVVGLLTGLVVALKLFFWPVLVWLVATRRYKGAALAALSTVLLVLLPWAGIGFAGLRSYPHLLSIVSSYEGPHSYSVAALFHSVVPNWTAAIAGETVIGAALLLLAVAAGRRLRDRDAFALTIAAVLVLTPLLEMHYLAALIVIAGLYQQRFGLAWLAPLLIWGASATMASSGIQVLHVLIVTAVSIGLAMTGWTWAARPGSPRSRLSKRLAAPGRKGAGPSMAPP